MKKSLGHAIDGLVSAFRSERNIRLFLWGYVPVLILGGLVGLLMWEWLAIIIAGGCFLTIELLNTAIEHCADIMDDHHKLLGGRRYHESIKTAKDVAAGASLTALLIMIIVTVAVFWPYAMLYLA